jgi:hypothetical protein
MRLHMMNLNPVIATAKHTPVPVPDQRLPALPSPHSHVRGRPSAPPEVTAVATPDLGVPPSAARRGTTYADRSLAFLEEPSAHYAASGFFVATTPPRRRVTQRRAILRIEPIDGGSTCIERRPALKAGPFLARPLSASDALGSRVPRLVSFGEWHHSIIGDKKPAYYRQAVQNLASAAATEAAGWAVEPEQEQLGFADVPAGASK